MSAFCLHPGVIRTELGRHVESWFPLLGALLRLPALLLMKTPWQGCQTTVFCAVTPGLEDRSGCYFRYFRPPPPSPWCGGVRICLSGESSYQPSPETPEAVSFRCFLSGHRLCVCSDCEEKEAAPEGRDDEAARRLWDHSARLVRLEDACCKGTTAGLGSR